MQQYFCCFSLNSPEFSDIEHIFLSKFFPSFFLYELPVDISRPFPIGFISVFLIDP